MDMTQTHIIHRKNEVSDIIRHNTLSITKYSFIIGQDVFFIFMVKMAVKLLKEFNVYFLNFLS